MSDSTRHPGDEATLAEAAEAHLENEADRLVAALLDAERTVRSLDPELLATLDAHAAAYQESCDTWFADMKCGDLPPDHRALDRAVETRKHTRNEMYGLILLAGNPPQWSEERRGEVDALYQAAAAVHSFLADLDDEDTHGTMQEYVAGALGESAYRYTLGP
jgi:hypothetical protein